MTGDIVVGTVGELKQAIEHLSDDVKVQTLNCYVALLRITENTVQIEDAE